MNPINDDYWVLFEKDRLAFYTCFSTRLAAPRFGCPNAHKRASNRARISCGKASELGADGLEFRFLFGLYARGLWGHFWIWACSFPRNFSLSDRAGSRE